MSFQSPLALFALLLLPALAAAYLLLERRRSGAESERFTSPALLPNLVDRSPGRLRYLPVTVLGVALAAMIVGVARPHATVSVPREEATVLLAIDVSRSMGAGDVEPTRLTAALNAARRFLARVPEKFRVGVISFGSNATLAVPPTADRTLVAQGLASLRPGEGTAIGDAVALAADQAKRGRASDGSVPPTAVLLISDGARDGGRTAPAAAVQKARAQHMPVYTILLGTPDGTIEVPIQGGYTQVIRVPPQPQTLRTLARGTGGQFFTATNDERLRDVYEKLGSRLGKRKESRELTDVFAGGSAALMLAGGLLGAFLFRRIP